MRKAFGVALLFVVICCMFPVLGETFIAIFLGVSLGLLFLAACIWLMTLVAKGVAIPLTGAWLVHKNNQRKAVSRSRLVNKPNFPPQTISERLREDRRKQQEAERIERVYGLKTKHKTK